MKELVIWAHSECRSNVAMFAEVKRLAEVNGLHVTMCLWDMMPMDEARKTHCLDWIKVGENLEKGRFVLAKHSGNGSVHVFCVYQNSSTWRQLIVEAKRTGARVVVNAEAPCEMGVGVKAYLKRLYYRWILPKTVSAVVRNVDLFINASGRFGEDRLVRLGWNKKIIMPFGYASDISEPEEENIRYKAEPCDLNPAQELSTINILHTGIELPYRDVTTLCQAVKVLASRGVSVDIVRTHGTVSICELQRLYRWANVFVACGICEPWGMRVNDAIHAGLPVFVSEGMGAKWLVEQFGCGYVFRKGKVQELAEALFRFSQDAEWRKRLIKGVQVAHEAWTPKARAKVWLKAVCGE